MRLDHLDEVFAAVAVPTGQIQQLPDPDLNSGRLGRPNNGDAPTSAELESPLISKHSECPKDGVGMNTYDGGDVPGRGQSFARASLPLSDITSDLGGHLLVQGHGVSPNHLDFHNGNRHHVTIWQA